MDPLIQYSLPVRGLRVGAHRFDFQVDKAFFSQFEDSPVQEGAVNVTLTLDKRPDMLLLEFDFAGTVKTDCDRCLAPINLPVKDTQHLIVKFSETEEAEDADVIYVQPDIQQLHVAKYVYEYIILSMPIIRVYNCEDEAVRPCNQEMLRYLQNGNDEAEPETTTESNPIWEELKKLNKNDN
ncbi:MAG: YceD family protein [Saprospiraceae bacterium]